MKTHRYLKDGLATFSAETVCGIYIHKEFTTCNRSEITCKNCLSKLTDLTVNSVNRFNRVNKVNKLEL